MSEVISGKNLTTIVLTESEMLDLVSCLRIIEEKAKLGNRRNFEQKLCDKLSDLFDALDV
jgi:Trp operon repressor